MDMTMTGQTCIVLPSSSAWDCLVQAQLVSPGLHWASPSKSRWQHMCCVPSASAARYTVRYLLRPVSKYWSWQSYATGCSSTFSQLLANLFTDVFPILLHWSWISYATGFFSTFSQWSGNINVLSMSSQYNSAAADKVIQQDLGRYWWVGRTLNLNRVMIENKWMTWETVGKLFIVCWRNIDVGRTLGRH